MNLCWYSMRGITPEVMQTVAESESHVTRLELEERRKEGRCLSDNTIIYNDYLYSSQNSQETVAKAKLSR